MAAGLKLSAVPHHMVSPFSKERNNEELGAVDVHFRAWNDCLGASSNVEPSVI